MNLAQRGGDDFDLRMLLGDVGHHADEGAGIELALGGNFRTGDAKAELQVFFVADEHIHVLDDAVQDGHGAVVTAGDVPELGAVIQVEGGDGTGGLGGLHGFDDDFRRRGRQRGEDAAAVEPPDAAGEDFLPVEVAGLELRRRFVAAVVEHDRRADALAAVAIDSSHVRAVDAVVLEVFVEGFNAHGADALGDEVADGVVRHGRSDAGLQAEAVGEVGRDVEFAAADVDVTVSRLAERDDARVKTMNKSAEGQEVQLARGGDVEAVFHNVGDMIFRLAAKSMAMSAAAAGTRTPLTFPQAGFRPEGPVRTQPRASLR